MVQIAQATKALDGAAAAISGSVVATPDRASPVVGDAMSYMLWIANAADAMIPWGMSPKQRDRQLRDFLPMESYLMGAVGNVSARNAAFSWVVEGGDQTVEIAKDILENANLGKGWDDWSLTTSMDLYSQDSGAFVEIIRMKGENAAPTDPVIGINHLDAQRVYATGNPETPYYYQDIKGKWHPMKWFQIVNLHELPSGREHPVAGTFYRLQYSAATRALRNAQIIRNLSIYEDEKTGGRFTKAVHFISGVTQKQYDDAMARARLEQDDTGFLRYMAPPVVVSPNPSAKIERETIEIAGLPDHFDKEVTMKWHIASLALAFLTDYQEFAPLPGGGLGTSAQSQMLHAKSRGKGPLLYQKLVTRLLNYAGVLPPGVSFRFTEQDKEAEAEQAQLYNSRATAHQILVSATILDAQAAREKMLADGDLTQQQFDDLTKREEEREQERASMAAEQERMGDTQPQGGGERTPDETVQTDAVAGAKALTTLIVRGLKDQALGAVLQSRIHKAFTDSADDLYALGYLDTEGRIQLSNVIGDTLRAFSDQLDAEAWELVNQNVAGVDVQALIGALATKAGTKEIPAGRLALDEAATDEAKEILSDVQAELAKALRRRQSPGEAAVVEVKSAARPAVVVREQQIVRDGDGMVVGARTRETVEAWE